MESKCILLNVEIEKFKISENSLLEVKANYEREIEELRNEVAELTQLASKNEENTEYLQMRMVK